MGAQDLNRVTDVCNDDTTPVSAQDLYRVTDVCNDDTTPASAQDLNRVTDVCNDDTTPVSVQDLNRVTDVCNDDTTPASAQNSNRVTDVCNDPAVISLDVMAERVYANLRNAGDTTTVVFDTFLSTLRTQFELESGREWKQNFLKITRRMFSKLVAENITDDVAMLTASDLNRIELN